MREEEGWGEMREEREDRASTLCVCVCVCVCDRRKKEIKKVGYTVDEEGDAEGELLEPVPV